MDIAESCRALIKQHLDTIEHGDERDENVSSSPYTQAPNTTEAFADRDSNMTKILNQQAHLKRIIDEDNNILATRVALTKISQEIEELRKQCTDMNTEALRNRQALANQQAKDIEKYQMNQLRSIAEDHSRHQEILAQRKKEILNLKKEIENEEKGREAYLKDVEKKLDKQLQDRERMLKSGGSLPFTAATTDDNDPCSLELTSVVECAPYGAAPHSRLPRAEKTRARGRGRRRGGRG